MKNEKIYSPEEIAAIRQVIGRDLKIEYQTFLNAYLQDPTYLEYRDGKPLTETDFISDILDDGKLQLSNRAKFEDVVAVGASTIASSLGLLE